MRNFRIVRRRPAGFFVAVALGAIVPLMATAASADVKIVSKVSRPAGPGGADSGTVTTYYKGDKVRMEEGGRVMIIDAAAQKMYQINPAQKTYSVIPMGPPPEAARMMGAMDIKTMADIKPNGKTRLVAGKPTKGYTFHATISMGIKPNAAAQMGGGGANGGLPPRGMPSSMGTITISGEEWVTQAIALPPGASGLGVAGQFGQGRQIPGMKPMIDKLASVKGLPLSVTQTISGTGMMGAFFGGGGGRPPMGAGRPPQAPPPPPPGGGLKVMTEAVSVTETPLPASLFSIPTGYKQEQRALPGMGGGGPGGRMRPGMAPPPPGGGHP